MEQKKERVVFIDILNILACFCVVWLHCTGKVFSFDLSLSWICSLAFQTVAHFSIPVFFMLTGATLLEYRKRYSTADFFRKRFVRIFLPFLFWSAVYILLGLRWKTIELHGVWDFFDVMLNNKVQYIFWFFYVLLGIYLMIPAFSLVIEYGSRKIVAYFCVLCFVMSTGLSLLKHFFDLGVTGFFQIPVASVGFFGYVLLGWLLKGESWNKPVRILIYVGGILGGLLVFFGTYGLSIEKGKLDSFWMNYESLGCLLMATAVFLMVKHLPWGRWVPQGTKRYKIIQTLSKASFGIYLIQIIALRYVPKVFHLNTQSGWYMIFGTILIYALCFMAVAIAQKIPGIRRLFP